MNNGLKPYFGAFWGSREQSYGDFASQVRTFLQGLREIDPVLSVRYALGDEADAEVSLGEHFEQLDSLIAKRAWHHDTPRDRFTDLDPEGKPTSASLSRVGWSLSVVNEPENVRTDGHVNVSFYAGSHFPRAVNNVLVKLHDPNARILQPAIQETVFAYLIESWRPETALVTNASFRDAVRDDETMEQFGWLNFRRDRSFERFLPPTVPRALHGGGLVFMIGDGRVLDASHEQEVATGLAIQDAIRASLA